MDDEVAAVRGAQARVRASIDVLVAMADELDPDVTTEFSRPRGYYRRNTYARRADYDTAVDPADFSDDELGAARMCLAMSEEREAWLSDRVAQLRARREYNEANQVRATQGVGRFLGHGKFDLDRITGATANTPAARDELRAERRAERDRAYAAEELRLTDN